MHVQCIIKLMYEAVQRSDEKIKHLIMLINKLHPPNLPGEGEAVFFFFFFFKCECDDKMYNFRANL